ncbi:MAG: hypothetical protein AAFQ05_04650 [Pseudomonadota bacterium]
MIYNAPPAEIKKTVGGHNWHKLRTSSTKANVNRMVLRLVGGWSFEEAMEWPAHERRHAKSFLKFSTKSVLLIACRHTQPGERLLDNYRLAEDFVRLGGTIYLTWGRKRLKREHDALAVKRALDSSDPTPWANPWYFDIGGYTFTLLESEAELAIEGASQRHCCRSYAQACRYGTETAFSIIGPERATMSWNSRLDALQVKSFANGPVSSKTKTAASRCVSEYLKHKIAKDDFQDAAK